jgi:hypothetical protein
VNRVAGESQARVTEAKSTYYFLRRPQTQEYLASFSSNGAGKLALFPRCILSEFVRFLYLPSSVYARIGSGRVSAVSKEFLVIPAFSTTDKLKCFAGGGRVVLPLLQAEVVGPFATRTSAPYSLAWQFRGRRNHFGLCELSPADLLHSLKLQVARTLSVLLSG